MSVLDDLQLPMPQMLLVSQDLYDEYHTRKREILRLKKAGTHPAEIRVALRDLGAWCVQKRAAGMSGNWAVVLAPT